MDGGIVHGIGMKGRVIDYGGDDLESLQQIKVEHVESISIYILQHNKIIEQQLNPELLPSLIKQDTKKQYVVKEFMNPPIYSKAIGLTKRSYLLRELAGFQHIIPLFKKHNIIGMPYHSTILFGIEIFMKEIGVVYDGVKSRCFVINKKCKETLTNINVTEATFLRLTKDILLELNELKKINIAHGDIKLDNIMKCGKSYELIDWENSRELDYAFLKQRRFLGLSPMYFKILYGNAWYPSFSVALLKYYREVGGHSEYANQMISHFSELFKMHSTEDVFELVKYQLDVATFGMLLHGIIEKNPKLEKYKERVMQFYHLDAPSALRLFKSKTRKQFKT
jgi:serine/threonine protein kinase